MGSNRNIIVLVVLAALLGVLYYFSSRHRAHIDTTGGFTDLVEGTLSTDDVFGIRVHRGVEADGGIKADGGFEMVKRGDDWVMPNHFDAPANVNKIRTLLGNLESVTGEFRSDDPEVLGDYDLADSTAYQIEVRDESGNDLVDLLVGKRSGSGSFVRQNGSNRVLLADHNFLSDFGIWGDERKDPDQKSWIDLVAFKVDRNDVRSIEIRSENSRISMEKEFPEPAAVTDSTDSTATAPPAPDPNTYEWRVTHPRNFLATRSRADGILNSLVSLRARDVVARGEAPEESGLGEDADRIVVGMADGSQHTLLFGHEIAGDDKQFYFEVEGEDLVWALPDYLRKNLFKTVDDLKAE